LINPQFRQLQTLIRDNEQFAEFLQNTETTNIDLINTATNIEKYKRIIENLNDNMNNDKENFWQFFFTENSFILSQIFVLPMIFYKGQAYLGGKNVDNNNGKYTDFLYKNINTHNAAIIEIKTPMSTLMNPVDKYRDGISTVHSDLTNAICQVYTQSDSFVKNYINLTQKQDDIKANNIEAILLIGKIESLDETQKDCFELFRNDLKRIKIVCFDELQERINFLLQASNGING